MRLGPLKILLDMANVVSLICEIEKTDSRIKPLLFAHTESKSVKELANWLAFRGLSPDILVLKTTQKHASNAFWLSTLKAQIPSAPIGARRVFTIRFQHEEDTPLDTDFNDGRYGMSIQFDPDGQLMVMDGRAKGKKAKSVLTRSKLDAAEKNKHYNPPLYQTSHLSSPGPPPPPPALTMPPPTETPNARTTGTENEVTILENPNKDEHQLITSRANYSCDLEDDRSDQYGAMAEPQTAPAIPQVEQELDSDNHSEKPEPETETRSKEDDEDDRSVEQNNSTDEDTEKEPVHPITSERQPVDQRNSQATPGLEGSVCQPRNGDLHVGQLHGRSIAPSGFHFEGHTSTPRKPTQGMDFKRRNVQFAQGGGQGYSVFDENQEILEKSLQDQQQRIDQLELELRQQEARFGQQKTQAQQLGAGLLGLARPATLSEYSRTRRGNSESEGMSKRLQGLEDRFQSSIANLTERFNRLKTNQHNQTNQETHTSHSSCQDNECSSNSKGKRTNIKLTSANSPSWSPGDEIAPILADLEDLVTLGLSEKECIYLFVSKNNLLPLYRNLSNTGKTSVKAFGESLNAAYGDVAATTLHRFSQAVQGDAEDEAILARRITRLFLTMRGQSSANPDDILGDADWKQVKERFISALNNANRRRTLRQIIQQSDSLDAIVQQARRLRKADEAESFGHALAVTSYGPTNFGWQHNANMAASRQFRHQSADERPLMAVCERCGKAHSTEECHANAKATSTFNKIQRGERRPIKQVTFDTRTGRSMPCYDHATLPDGCSRGESCPYDHNQDLRDVVLRRMDRIRRELGYTPPENGDHLGRESTRRRRKPRA